MVETHKDFQVLILSGSPIIGNFDFRSRVDFIRLPGVIKLRNGEYTALNLHIDIDQVLEMRASIMRHTAEIFDPDLFIVDKEPLGLRGDVRDTLASLRERGVPSVLGLRDVMDEPSLLAPEWERKNAVAALRDLYDEIWVYGLPQICEPLEGIELPKSVRRKIFYTGYLRRTLPKLHVPPMSLQKITEPYILVTTGGGGDGETVIDLVLQAYENDDRIPHPALLVLGPFMGGYTAPKFFAPSATSWWRNRSQAVPMKLRPRSNASSIGCWCTAIPLSLRSRPVFPPPPASQRKSATPDMSSLTPRPA